MSTSMHSPAAADSDDRTTVVAIAIVAFVLADIAHEVIGHGLGYLLAGGRSGIFTTTRLIATEHLSHSGANLLDLGGPFGNFLFAGLPWVAQRMFVRPAPQFRVFLWLVTTFSVFWGFGYMIFSGVMARGDWFAPIRDSPYVWLWRVLFVIVGIILYRASIRRVAAELRWVVSRNEGDWRHRVRRLVFLSYVAGGLMSCAGAVLDPRGVMEVLNSGALAGFAAAVGLLWVPARFPLVGIERDTALAAISRSHAWILLGLAVSVAFIAVLGPGIRFAFW